ncbi:type I-MYXAN CRISPR-associated protein Cas5/Cmx5/DevS [Nitrospira moscoviensis]|uniref:CRISPR-associated protein Cas5/DevS n=1 Tax=Nitrospira moscoviensis TaxID=42253 RepID=A0A0K2GAG9_NITMO|nr:CRISPR-associated protein Cas5/DevS [Nitrospira moscoviensis]
MALYVSIPIASFRAPQAREYFETLPCPPPSTVYGMLLSLVGEPDRLHHVGAQIAIALLSVPERSVVLRTLWRVKTRKYGPGIGENRRPDFQELLTAVRLAVWVRPGTTEASSPRLADRVRATLNRPAEINRFGGLCLGESTHLVDEIRSLRPADFQESRFLVRDRKGDLALPVWPDHVGSARTKWQQYRLVTRHLSQGPEEAAWTPILS